MGRMLKLTAAVLAALCFLNLPVMAEKRVALVVGNSTYVNVPRLDNSKNDARVMADTLRAVGFTLVGNGPRLDLDKSSFDAVVQEFGNQAQGADVALFYYAGHGVQVRGGNYLVPVAANPTRESDVDFQMLDANLVLRQMEDAGTKLNIVILDACRNNPFGGRGLRATSSGLAQMRGPEGTLISFATQPGAVALDGADGNSPYTKALVHTVTQPGLDIFRTFNEVGLQVASATGGAQQPWYSASPIRGNFYFAGESSANATQPAAAPVTAPPVPPVDQALQAWQALQNTTSEVVLEEFVRQFGGTVYAAMAKARLEELRKSKLAVVAPPPPPAATAPVGRNITVGVVGAKTGPLAAGAAIVHFPPYRLWAHEVNERGGLRLKDGYIKSS
jgi:uncharacterized caspase-like protein